MQRDVLEGRPSELEAQVGAVVRLGERLGVAVPLHRTIYAALVPLERRASGEVAWGVGRPKWSNATAIGSSVNERGHSIATHSRGCWYRRGPMAAALLALLIGCGRRPVRSPDAAADSLHLMTPQDLQALPSRAPDRRVSYGEDSSHSGELRVPAGAGPHPVVVLVHGGCFKAAYANARDFAPVADALKADGIATWNIEYRRLGQPGGGWPGTYLDVGRAVDYLRTLARQIRSTSVVSCSSGTPPAGTWRCGRRRALACRRPARCTRRIPCRCAAWSTWPGRSI